MPNVHDLKQNKYLTKEDVSPPILVTISAYEQVNVALESQEPEMKWALFFKETEKPLVLNQTNGNLIASIVGTPQAPKEEFEDWINHKIVLYNDPTIQFAGRVTGGIRVRAPKKGKYAPPNPLDDEIPY